MVKRQRSLTAWLVARAAENLLKTSHSSGDLAFMSSRAFCHVFFVLVNVCLKFREEAGVSRDCGELKLADRLRINIPYHLWSSAQSNLAGFKNDAHLI